MTLFCELLLDKTLLHTCDVCLPGVTYGDSSSAQQVSGGCELLYYYYQC